MFDLPQRAVEVRDQVNDFFQQRILPNHELWCQQAAAGQATPEIEEDLARRGESVRAVEHGAAATRRMNRGLGCRT